MAWQKDSSSVSQIPQASVSSVWSDYSLYSNPQAVVQQQQQHQTNVMTVPNYPLPTSWPVQAPYFIQSHTQIPIVSTSNPALMMNVPPIPTNATISQQYYDYYAFQQQQQQQQVYNIFRCLFVISRESRLILSFLVVFTDWRNRCGVVV
jgi:hypothetical protein